MVDPALLDNEAYQHDPTLAVEPLAAYLRQGALVLAVGAGASRGLGLPLWRDLVEKCVQKCRIEKGGANLPDSLEGLDGKELRLLMDQVEIAYGGKLNLGRSKAYRDMVRSCLYEGIEYGNAILKQDLLIAFGALLMGSKRGSIREVVNFNFDDVLDWYLALHGFQTQVVTDGSAVFTDADVLVFHPHGFLPLTESGSRGSDFLVLSQHSYDMKQGVVGDYWLDFFKKKMLNKVFVFIGLSCDDPTFGPAITAVADVVSPKRFTGFWVLGSTLDDSQILSLSQRNIVPLKLESYQAIPDFLLKICQSAATVGRS